MTVSVRKHLESNTLHLPELDAMLGKDVRIIVVEEVPLACRPDLSRLESLAGKIDLDYQAIDDLRARSLI